MIIDMQEAIKNKTAHPADTPADVKIAIKDLNLYYGAFHALHGINLDIERGKITAFIGPSGCGKSTLLKTLNRMNDLIPNCRITGNVSIDGEDIYDPRTDVAVELGGEDAKIIYFTGGLEERMNGVCAGGTGSFIDQMASLLQTDASGLNEAAAKAKMVYPIASRCGV